MIAFALALPGVVAATGVSMAIAARRVPGPSAVPLSGTVLPACLMAAEILALVGLATAAEAGATLLLGSDGRVGAELAAILLLAAGAIGLPALIAVRAANAPASARRIARANTGGGFALTVLTSLLSMAAVGHGAASHVGRPAGSWETQLLAGAVGAAVIFVPAMVVTLVVASRYPIEKV